MNYDDEKVRRRSRSYTNYDDAYDEAEHTAARQTGRQTAQTYDNRAAQSGNSRTGRSSQTRNSAYDDRLSRRTDDSQAPRRYAGEQRRTGYSEYPSRRSYSRTDIEYDEQIARRSNVRNAADGYSSRSAYDTQARRYAPQRQSDGYHDFNDYDDEEVSRQSTRRSSEDYRGEYSNRVEQRRRVRDYDEYDFSNDDRKYHARSGYSSRSGNSSHSGYNSRNADRSGRFAVLALLAVLLVIAIPLSVKAGLFSRIANMGTVSTASVPYDDVFATATPDPQATVVPEATEIPTQQPTEAPTEVPGMLLSSGRVLDPDKKAIALTFDDGPSKQSRKILATLEEYGGRCTFFVVGERLDDYSETLQLEYEAGCQIGMHTYSHANLRKLEKSEILEEINKTNDLIYKYLGVYSELLRPPYGAVNETVKATVEQPMINWSIDTLDWKSKDADSVYNEIMSNVEDGDIILMHDLYSSTAEAVARVVPELVEQGYQLCTIDELFELKGIELKVGSVYLSAKSKSDD